MRLHLGSDHGGIDLRQRLAAALAEAGHEVVSVSGPAEAATSVDYPDVAVEVCRRVLDDAGALGVLVCGTGQGMAITANKVAGIRAAVVSDCFSAKMAREHNDANILCLGQRVLGDELAKMLVSTFLEAEFAGGRHARRVAKIDAAGGS
ncbi:MAG: ribose 5-phosphate isomerase B [Nannocystaceae bacterium]